MQVKMGLTRSSLPIKKIAWTVGEVVMASEQAGVWSFVRSRNIPGSRCAQNPRH